MSLRAVVCSCVFLLLYFVEANGCYDTCIKGFSLEISQNSSDDIELCNNSYILRSNFNNQFGVIGNGYHNGISHWTIPSGVPLFSGNNAEGVLVQNGKLKKTNDLNFKNGIYRYYSNPSSTYLLGIYDNEDQNLIVNLQGDLVIDSYFTQPTNLTMNCRIQNYPPTCLYWLKNGTLLSSNVITTLLNASTTLYSSTLMVNSSDELIGNYSCTAVSIRNGTYSTHKSGSSQLLVEGPPYILPSNIKIVSSDTLIIHWEHNFTFLPPTSSLSYSVLYKEADFDDTVANMTNCGNTKQCTITALSPNVPYSFVIIVQSYDNSIFVPSESYDITIEEPKPIEQRNIVSLLHNVSGYVATEIKWVPSLYQDNVTVSYSASCNTNTTHLCTSGSQIVTGNSFNIESLIGGLDYSVSLVANNAVGTSPATEITISQNPTVPTMSPQSIETRSNSSSIFVKWVPVSCCDASGEQPQYIITLNKSNAGEVTTATLSSVKTQHTFTGLDPVTEYAITISSVNSIGKGPLIIRNVNTEELPPIDPTTGTTNSATVPTATSDYYVLAYIGGFGAFIVLLLACIACCIVAYILRSHFDRGYRHHRIHDDDAEFSSYIPLADRNRCEKPYLLEFPKNTKASEGESIHFLVQIAGTPEPTWFWQHQGEPISSQGNIQIFSDGTLVIDKIKPENGGLYTFIARNVGGDLRQEVKLVVLVDDEDNRLESFKTQHARSLIIEHKPVPIDTLERYVEMHHTSDNEAFSFLYTSLSSGPYKTNSKANENGERNRYKNIVPYDDNIVELDPIPGWDTFQHTYINASYIDGYKTEKKFISTQGPLPYTVGDFWRMIWKERSPIIVMLTNRIEGNRVKSEEYWPSSISNELELGPFIVKLLSEETYANFTIRKCTILSTDGSQSYHEIEHFHFTTWPDHGVPDHGSPLLLFHQKIMEQYAVRGGPITVHCSAGVGRTGTFIALDIGLCQVKEEQEVDFVNIVNQLREKRMKMVQTIWQFMFLHDTLLEHVLCGNTLIPVAKLSETLAKLHEVGSNKKTGFETQFQLIRKITPKLDEYRCDIGKANPEKNRHNSLLPMDVRRVVLKGYSLDYINASYIDGYQIKKEFIITQSPIATTVSDFWKMIVQHKSCTIVMLCSLEENFKDVCHQYWPSDSDITVAYDQYSIKLMNEVNESDNIIRRTLGVKDMISGHCQTVVQLQINNWLPDGKCSNHCTIGDLYGLVCDSQRRSGMGTKPMIVHCSDTVTRSAMYCATHNAIEQAKLEQACDIFQAVKTLRMQRPGSIPSVEHYETVYELINSCLSSYVMYSQFKS